MRDTAFIDLNRHFQIGIIMLFQHNYINLYSIRRRDALVIAVARFYRSMSVS